MVGSEPAANRRKKGFHPRSIGYGPAGCRRKKVPMELLLVIIIVILLFGGGFSLYRR
jgi:hypothetical protein